MTDRQPIITIEHQDDVKIVVILEESLLSDVNLNRLEMALTPLALVDGPIKLIIDFHKVCSVSSSVLGFLVTFKKLIEKYQGRLILCCIEKKVANAPSDRYIYELFKVVQLDRFFEIAADVEEALAKMNPS